MPDQYWQSSFPATAAGYAHWLRDKGSLTLRIQHRCTAFSVRNMRNCLAPAARDETGLLGLPPRQKIYTREVLLYADGMPIVFAHSVVALQHLRGAWRVLQNLGDKPLGALLFAHPLVERAPLHYKAIKTHHTLYRGAAAVLDAAPRHLWARRSLFSLHAAPLLVTEVFLPGILKLHK